MLIQAYDAGMLNSEVSIQYPDDFDVRSDEQKTVAFDNIHEKVQHSPTAQMLSDFAYIKDNVQLSREEMLQVQKELEDGYFAENQDMLADEESTQMLQQEIEEEQLEQVQDELANDSEER